MIIKIIVILGNNINQGEFIEFSDEEVTALYGFSGDSFSYTSVYYLLNVDSLLIKADVISSVAKWGFSLST